MSKEEQELQEKYSLLLPFLNERDRRLTLAAEAMSLGFGGVSKVHRATGVARSTITTGIHQLKDHTAVVERVREKGGGRKKLSVHVPELSSLVENEAQPKGNPMSALRWTTLSMEHIAKAVTRLGYPISAMSVYRILKAKGFALKANKKVLEGGRNHPDRNAQFEHIAMMGLRMQLAGVCILSVDCKKTELIGRFKNNGREWQPKGSEETVNVYDFGEKDATGNRIKAIPYGVYNILKKQGFINVGIDHNTAEFAVQSIRRYWEHYGRRDYPDTNELLLLADGGSSNGAKNRLWKVALQKLANETGLTIHVSHYPPGTSKWNAIEHQLFSFISINWRAKPLLSYEVILELLNHTTTQKGLTVDAVLDTNRYPTGIKITDQEIQQLNLERDAFHGDWNYTIKPNMKL